MAVTDASFAVHFDTLSQIEAQFEAVQKLNQALMLNQQLPSSSSSSSKNMYPHYQSEGQTPSSHTQPLHAPHHYHAEQLPQPQPLKFSQYLQPPSQQPPPLKDATNSSGGTVRKVTQQQLEAVRVLVETGKLKEDVYESLCQLHGLPPNGY